MPTYSVADAKAGLPRLIDRAMAGEEVIITRYGAPVVESGQRRTRVCPRRGRPMSSCGPVVFAWPARRHR